MYIHNALVCIRKFKKNLCFLFIHMHIHNALGCIRKFKKALIHVHIHNDLGYIRKFIETLMFFIIHLHEYTRKIVLGSLCTVIILESSLSLLLSCPWFPQVYSFLLIYAYFNTYVHKLVIGMLVYMLMYVFFLYSCILFYVGLCT